MGKVVKALVGVAEIGVGILTGQPELIVAGGLTLAATAVEALSPKGTIPPAKLPSLELPFEAVQT